MKIFVSGVHHVLRDNFKPRFASQQCNMGLSWDEKLKKALICSNLIYIRKPSMVFTKK
jgi:hypothetical protein